MGFTRSRFWCRACRLKARGLGGGYRVLEALEERIDRGRARVDDRLRMHAVEYDQERERQQRRDLAWHEVGDRPQIGFLDHAENEPTIEIERIADRQDQAEGGEEGDPGVGLEGADQSQELTDEA